MPVAPGELGVLDRFITPLAATAPHIIVAELSRGPSSPSTSPRSFVSQRWVVVASLCVTSAFAVISGKHDVVKSDILNYGGRYS